MPTAPRLYDELADWWHVLSPPADYAEEAGIYARLLREHATIPIRTVLELGSGGGNNASHMKSWFELTLVELSPAMLAQSQRLNPGCAHRQGDMRTVRLGREFDAVFVHDAIGYMASEDDLRRAIETAYVHCRPGGAALFAPDTVRETFRDETSHGGSDAADRALRYLEWSWDPDPGDSSFLVDYVYAMRFADGSVRVEHDRHVQGLFARQTWIDIVRAAGFTPLRLPIEHSELETGTYEVFVGVKA